MDREKFSQLLTARLRDKVARHAWSLGDIAYAVEEIKTITAAIDTVDATPDGYEISYLAGCNVPRVIGYLYNIHTYLDTPVYTKLNGVIARLEKQDVLYRP